MEPWSWEDDVNTAVRYLPRSVRRYDAADQRLWIRVPKAHNTKVVVTR